MGKLDHGSCTLPVTTNADDVAALLSIVEATSTIIFVRTGFVICGHITGNLHVVCYTDIFCILEKLVQIVRKRTVAQNFNYKLNLEI